MADLTQLSSTLSTQQSTDIPPEPQLPSGAPPQPEPNTVETSVKRKPGRPKGSGKKTVDPNEPPKAKRPVGRPRKDGLPAGSLGPKKPSNRNRKRPPGKFAAEGAPISASNVRGHPHPIAVFSNPKAVVYLMEHAMERRASALPCRRLYQRRRVAGTRVPHRSKPRKQRVGGTQPG